jgi:hypothetical protein
MTKNSFIVIKNEIEKELKDLNRLNEEMREVLGHPSPSFLETRAAGSILHDFYCGVEKIFRRIASRIDGDMPTGEDWHTELLDRMAIPIDGLRPEVISGDVKERLSEYLRFRHLFRNIYGFELKWERCAALGRDMQDAFDMLRSDIKRFLDFLDALKG